MARVDEETKKMEAKPISDYEIISMAIISLVLGVASLRFGGTGLH